MDVHLFILITTKKHVPLCSFPVKKINKVILVPKEIAVLTRLISNKIHRIT